MPTGKIKWFHVARGYGFISPDAIFAEDGEVDVFLHFSQLEKLGIIPKTRWDVEGMNLRYDIKLDSKGRKAMRQGR